MIICRTVESFNNELNRSIEGKIFEDIEGEAVRYTVSKSALRKDFDAFLKYYEKLYQKLDGDSLIFPHFEDDVESLKGLHDMALEYALAKEIITDERFLKMRLL